MSPVPTTTWNTTTIGGIDYLVISTAEFRVPLDFDSSSNMFIAVAAPTGGLGSFPALVKGDTGDPPDLDTISFTALEPTDPTPDSASWIETSPGVWQLHLALHKGQKGDDGDTVITPSDFGTVVAKKVIVVNDAANALVYQTQKVGTRYVAASFNNAPAGNTTYTLGQIAVPAQDWDWYPEVSGAAVVTGTSADVRVDLVARLNNSLSGNIVGRGFGTVFSGGILSGITPESITLASGPPANASSGYDKVLAGATATIYLQAERIAGSGTFTTTAADTYFNVWVRPIP